MLVRWLTPPLCSVMCWHRNVARVAHSQAAIFPKAESLLIATATANNRAFADVAQRKYTTAMDKVRAAV